MDRIGRPTLALIVTLSLFATTSPLCAQDKDQPEKKLPSILDAKPLKADAKDDELKKLLIARYNAAVEEMTVRYALIQAGQADSNAAFESSQRLLLSGLELCDKPADRVTLLTQYLELTRAVEKVMDLQVQAGKGLRTDLSRALYYRIDAEIQLLKAKREAEKAKDK